MSTDITTVRTEQCYQLVSISALCYEDPGFKPRLSDRLSWLILSVLPSTWQGGISSQVTTTSCQSFQFQSFQFILVNRLTIGLT